MVGEHGLDAAGELLGVAGFEQQRCARARHQFGEGLKLAEEVYKDDPNALDALSVIAGRSIGIPPLTGERLFHMTGGLMIGPPSGELVTGAERSAIEHGIVQDFVEWYRPEVLTDQPASDQQRRVTVVVEQGATDTSIGRLLYEQGLVQSEIAFQYAVINSGREGTLAAGTFDLDSHLWRTLIALLRRPGLLTAEYMVGRRRPYRPTLR